MTEETAAFERLRSALEHWEQCRAEVTRIRKEFVYSGPNIPDIPDIPSSTDWKAKEKELKGADLAEKEASNSLDQAYQDWRKTW